MKKDIACERCEKEGVIELTPDGYLPERMAGWYWSDNDQCFYCKPCEAKLVEDMLEEIKTLCKDNGVEILDLNGNPIE